MNFQGAVIGVFSFIIIGVFHPIVIKGEYYFTSRIWPLFLAAGMILLALSVFTESIFASSLLSITGFTCLWTILELKEQEERVRKGWFPKNPNRTDNIGIKNK